jgi:drug/metabolite transporter (DMT)-like permease
VTAPEWILLVANVVYGSSYVTTRLVLDDVPPATLAFARVTLGAAVLWPLARWVAPEAARRLRRGDYSRLAAMGLAGFAGAFAAFHWGLALSTATNAALLITVEPIALILLAPVWLGERLTRREVLGAGFTLAGAAVVVLNGLPGLTIQLAPHWRGDLLLILSGLAYASYSLFGREVLARHPALPVTAWSMAWAAAGMLPLAALEWLSGSRLAWTPTAVWGTLYLALVMTALGYLVWNYALERVSAPRVAVFINLQPLVGALLGVVWLGEPVTGFTVAGGALALAGLSLTVRRS